VAYSPPVDIGNKQNGISTTSHEVDPFIAPDESYLIFASDRPGGYGEADLYICFRQSDGTWPKAQNMGPSINTKTGELCPSVSPDGKYLFFSSNRSLYPNYSETPITYAEKERILNSPGNGNPDIYWVDAKIIEELKSKE
jgi:Tol biopolymer transport system component